MVDQFQRRKTAVTAIGGYVLNPKKHNLSFGRWAIPVMAKKMQSPEVNERRKAVQSLCDFVFDSRRVASKEFRTTPAGRHAFDEYGFYQEILNFLKDDSEDVRFVVNIGLQRLVTSPFAAEGLVKAEAIPILIERISKEPDHILEVLLQTLHTCCLIDPESALSSKCMEAALPSLKNSSAGVRARLATVIKDLTEVASGRSKALELEAVPLLLNLCHSEDEQVVAKALAALMIILLSRIASATPLKLVAIEENAIQKILPLVNRKNPEIRLNAIKVLTALSEAPAGRKQLVEKIPQLLHLLNDEIEEVRRATKILNSVVTFKP